MLPLPIQWQPPLDFGVFIQGPDRCTVQAPNFQTLGKRKKKTFAHKFRDFASFHACRKHAAESLPTSRAQVCDSEQECSEGGKMDGVLRAAVPER